MKTNTKNPLRIAAVFLLAAVLVLGTRLAISANAADSANVGETYYYEELRNSNMAQRLYKAIGDMTENENFTSGKLEYDLLANGVLTEGEVMGYVDKSLTQVPVALGAARDAFYMDNPDLFWFDTYKLYLSAGMQNGKYAAYLGTGSFDNYYVDNTVKNAQEVKTATEKYNAALAKAVAEVKKAGTDAVELVKAANKYVAENTEYDYGARKNAQGGVEYDGYVNTAYGSLVNGKALCGGYARAFKAIMDELAIPCALIQGSAYSGAAQGGEAGYEAHMWNAVQINGLWYGVDVTYNSSSANINKYTLVGDDFLSKNHLTDGVISSSGFELKYPAIRPFDYGVDKDNNGFKFKDEGKIGDKTFGYGKETSGGYSLLLGVSFNGKNAAELRAEGKHLVVSYMDEEGQVSDWSDIITFAMENGACENAGEYYCFYANAYVYKMRFAIMDMPSTVNDGYKYAKETVAQHIIAVSTFYANNAYNTYRAAPSVKKRIPDDNGQRKSFEPMDISLEYDEALVPTDGSEFTEDYKVQIDVFGDEGNMNELTKIENVKWDPQTNTLTFRFTPDISFAHNDDTYSFVPTNLMSPISEKVPSPGGYYTFARKKVICPRVFNDGRLYMMVYGKPQFVEAEDLSTSEFKDKNGKPVVGNQRSQLMLVVDEPTSAASKDMEDKLLGSEDMGLDKTDIKSSSTYQIDLQVCGVVQKVPNGSYMQVGFGFPNGYGPDDAGVTFSVYHYKLDDDGVIIGVEKIPCVITKYGIIATVKSFSPFMVCAIDSLKADSGVRNIYASVNGNGGKIDKTVITTLKSGESVTYKLTPDEGYEISSVMLGKTNKKADVNANGEITLGYNDIADEGVLEVSFAAKRVVADRAASGFNVVSPRLVVSSADMIIAVEHKAGELPEEDSNVALIVTLVIVAVLVIAAAAVLVWFFLFKKDGGKGKPASGKKGGSARTATAARPVTATATASATAATRNTVSAPSARPVARPTTATATQKPAATSAARPTTATTRPATAARPATTSAARPTTAATRPAARPATTAAPKKPDGKK